MVGASASELWEQVVSAACGPDDLDRAKIGLSALRQLRILCDAKDVELAAMVARCTPAPEGHLREAGKLSDREAERQALRSQTAVELPAFAEALASGEIRGEHLDALARARRRLDPAEREKFDREANQLAFLARNSDPDAFSKAVARAAQRARTRDGEDEHARQKRAARCRTYVSHVNGMWVLHLEVDQLTGLKLDAKVRATVETLFADGLPETCPKDPFEKQDHLRALAVTELLLGLGGKGMGPPEFIAVIDTRCAAHAASASGDGGTTCQEHTAHEPCESTDVGDVTAETSSAPAAGDQAVEHDPAADTSSAAAAGDQAADHDPAADTSSAAAAGDQAAEHEPAAETVESSDRLGERDVAEATPCWGGDDLAIIDYGLPVELPRSVLEQFLPRARIIPVVLCRGVVIHAPGQLNLGRTNRLANAAQRRVLRAMYSGCAIPGCSTRFDYCKIHHVVWWRHGGPTDLANLLPICVRHHSKVHDHGWVLELTADRTLRVTRPDGTTMTTGPPSRHAA